MTTTPGTFTGIPIEAVLCVRRPGSNGIGVTAAADVAAACSSVRPLAFPETLALGFDTNQVMYKSPSPRSVPWRGARHVRSWLTARTQMRQAAQSSLTSVTIGFRSWMSDRCVATAATRGLRAGGFIVGAVIGIAFMLAVAGYAIWRNMSDGIGNNRISTRKRGIGGDRGNDYGGGDLS